MKKISFKVGAIVFLVLSSYTLQAQETCGGTIEPSPDCSNSGRKYKVSCCRDGYRFLGVAYTDIKDQDHVDAVSAYCLSPTNEAVLVSDFSRTPKQFLCEYYERAVGIESKDVLTDGGSRKDELDGVSVVCLKPGDANPHTVPNKDMKGDREGRDQVVSLDKQILGIAYKEMDKGSSDRADCVTLVTK